MAQNPAQAGPSRLANPPYNLPLSAPPSTTSFPHNINLYKQNNEDDSDALDVLPTRAGRKLCVRHKQMANQNINAKLQKSLDNLPTSERSDITHLWATFSNAPHAKRKLILEGILTMCCFSQLSHLSDQLNEIIRVDPFSLLPREVNLRILGYLDAISLGRAAQVSKPWKALADDDLLWRRMCGQHIDRKCEKCGWGLPLLERRRLKVELKDFSPAAAMGVGGHEDHHHLHDHDHGNGHNHGDATNQDGDEAGPSGPGEKFLASKVITRTEALGGMDRSRAVVAVTCDPVAPAPPSITLNNSRNDLKRSAPTSPAALPSKKTRMAGSDSDSDDKALVSVKPTLGASSLPRAVRLTRPWKSVYCERLLVERNWRKGRCTTKTLRGHTDGVMCLQYHTALTNPSYPVLITGSYDKTVRVWNLDTGSEVRVLRGHTRAIRCLQFDQMLLFTGAMDGTVRMWNWRAGECLRVLEGHTDGVVCLNYNGYLLASGSADSTIQVWNFRTGSKFTLTGHTEWVNSVTIWDGKTSPSDLDPTIPPSFSSASGCKPRGGSSPNPHASLMNSNGADGDKKPEINPGTMLFSASDDCTIKMWDLTTRECIRTFEGHKAQIQTLKVMMVDMSEQEMKEALLRSRATTPPQQPQQQSNTSAWIAATQYPISPPQSQHGSLSPIHDTTGAVGHQLASNLRNPGGTLEPQVYVHDHEKKSTSTAGDDKDNETEEIGERQKKPLLVTGSLDGTIKLWDVESGKENATLFGHIEGVWSVDIDALRIASASHDRTVKVWDRESGNCVQTLVGHRGAVTSLQLSDDMIVSSSDDGDVMVWSFAPSASAMAGLNSPMPLTTV